MLDITIDHVSITGDVLIVTFSVYRKEKGFEKLLGSYKFQGVYDENMDLKDIAKIIVEKAKKHYEEYKKATDLQIELIKEVRDILKSCSTSTRSRRQQTRRKKTRRKR